MAWRSGWRGGRRAGCSSPQATAAGSHRPSLPCAADRLGAPDDRGATTGGGPGRGREIRAVVQFLVHCFGGLGWAEFRAFWSVHRQFKANVVPGRAPCEKWAVCRVLCPALTDKNGKMNNLVSPILSLK